MGSRPLPAAVSPRVALGDHGQAVSATASTEARAAMRTVQRMDIDDLIEQAASGARALAESDLHRILQYVAAAGFHPSARERVRGRLAGILWQGRTLTGTEQLPPVEVHCLWHVLRREEWPVGLTLDQYVESIR